MSQEELESELGRPRLKIQGDLPIRAIGIETQRERKHYTYLPPQNYIHIWWARRPTPASRLGVLSSVLPDTIDNDTLLKWMQIDPSNKPDDIDVAAHVREKSSTVDQRNGAVHEHYGYRKIWTQTPSKDVLGEIHETVANYWGGELPTILDATAGGGSIPFESIRYGFPTIANELNPVASVILRSVLVSPRVDGDLSEEIEKWGQHINDRARETLEEFLPSQDGEKILEFLWAHVITCPDCGLSLPLSTNWWLDKNSSNSGTAARPIVDGNDVSFSIVDIPGDVDSSEFNPTKGTVKRGKATCLQCSVTISGEEIKNQAGNGEIGEQLYSIHFESIEKGNDRGFRAPRQADREGYLKAVERVQNDIELSSFLSEDIPEGEKTDEPRRYGMHQWRDMY